MYRPTGEDMHTAFLRTLLADVDRTGPEPRRRGSMYLEYFDERLSASKAWDLQHQAMRDAVVGRRLGYTSTGLMRLLPAEARADDGIYTLCDGQVLYRLRQSDRKYHSFINECCVHELMDGQAFQKQIGTDSQI